MKKASLIIALGIAWVTKVSLLAQISVTGAPGAIISFAEHPTSADWTTRSIPGIDATYGTAPALESAVQAYAAASITSQLLNLSPTNPPSQTTLASWTSAGGNGYIQTRPTANGATLLMATLRNVTGSIATSLRITYSLAAGGVTLAEQIPSQQVFYSLSGAGGSWISVPGLSGGGAGFRSNSVALSGTWTNNGILYVLWVDDNATSGPDNSWQIDNITFAAGNASVPLSITLTEPSDGLVLLAPAEVSVSAFAAGTVPPSAVRFYTNGYLFTTLFAPPFSAQFSAVEPGIMRVHAVAENAGETAFSRTNSIRVRDEFIRYSGEPYTENFDSMGPTGTETPLGWYVGSVLPATTMNLAVGDGSFGPNSAVLGWNYGNTTTPANRSLGTAPTGVDRNIVLRLQNNAPNPIRAFAIRYDSEVWRHHTNTTERLTNYVSFDLGSTWIPTGFDFHSPVQPVNPATALDGHDEQNRIADIGGFITPPSPVAPGDVIYIRWHNFNDFATDGALAIDNFAFWHVVAPPEIVSQPEGTNASLGATVSFQTTVITQEGALRFQWYKNDSPVAGATNSSLILTNVTFSSAGGYHVTISYPGGSVTSVVAMLTVTPVAPPEIWRVPLTVSDVGSLIGSPLLAQEASGAVISVSSVQTNFSGQLHVPSSMLVSKVAKNGTKTWETRYYEPYGRELEPQALSTDTLGNIYIAGLADKTGLFVMKYSRDGQRLWASMRQTEFGATDIFLDPTGFITTWTVDNALAAAWDPVAQWDIFSWKAGGWAFLDNQGSFRAAHPNGNGQPVPATVRVVNTSTLSMLAWGGFDFGIKNVEMLTDTWVLEQPWPEEVAPPANQVMMRESPAGVHVVQMRDGAVSLQLFTRTGISLWPKVYLPVDGPLLDLIPALGVDSEGNSFFAAVHQNGTANDITFCRVRPTGEIGWQARYSDYRSQTNLAWSGYSRWKSMLRLVPDGGGGLYAIVGRLTPELLRFSSRGVHLWDIADSRNVPAIGDLLVREPLIVSPDQSLTMAVRDLSGVSPTGQVFLVRRDFASVPPSSPISMPANGSTVPAGQPLQVAASDTTRELNLDSMEFFLDGELIGTSTNWPYSTLLPSLSIGQHTLQTRSYDRSGTFSWSPQSLVYGGQVSPTISINSNDFQRVVFVTYATEALFRGEVSFDGVLDSALISVIAAIHRKMPQLPSEFYSDLIDDVRARAAAATVVGFLPAAAPPPADPDAKLKYWLEQIPRIIHKSVESIPVVGGILSDQLSRDLKEIARRCDEDPGSANPGACNIVKFYDIKWRDVEDVVTMVGDNIISSQQTLFAKFTSGIWRKMDMQTSEIVQAFNAQFDGVNDQFGKVLNNLETLVDGQSQLVVGQNRLLAEFSSFSADVRVGMANQLAISQEILGTQQNIWAFLTNQAYQAEVNAQKQYAEELKLKGLQSGVYLLSTLFELGGNPELARKVAAVGENSFRLSNAIDEYIKGRGVNNLAASTILSANVISIGLSLAQSMNDTGPTPDEIILEQLAAIQHMIVDLGKQMHERFDRVDQALIQLYTDFSERFAAIDFRLGQIESQLDFLQSSLDRVNQKLDGLQRDQYLLAQDEERSRLYLTQQEAGGYSPGAWEIPYTEFNAYAAYFFKYAENDSRDSRFSPFQNLSTQDAELSASLAAAAGPTNTIDIPGTLSYLARLSAERGWAAGRFRGNVFPNLVEWQAGVDAYLNLIKSWPMLARVRPNTSSNLFVMRQTADQIRVALQDLVLIDTGGPLRANRAFWQALFHHYRSKANNSVRALNELEHSYLELSLARPLDPHSINSARAVQLWGELSQPTGFEPQAFRSEMMFNGPGNEINGGNLAVPSGLMARVDATDGRLALFAEFLGLAETSISYGNVHLTDVRERAAITNILSTGSIIEGNWVAYGIQVWKLLDSRFNVSIEVSSTVRGSPVGVKVPVAGIHYVHPRLHWDSFQLWSYTNPVPITSITGLTQLYSAPLVFERWERYGYNNFGYVFGAPNSGQTQTLRYQTWDSPSQQFRSYWYGDDGGGEPLVLAVPSSILSTHPDWARRPMTPSRDQFSDLAAIESRLHLPFHPAPGLGTVRRAFEQQVKEKLRALQSGFYGKAAGELQSNSLMTAAAELTGARDVLVSFLRLALPQSFESSDFLRGLFFGAEPLPDGSELIRLCTRGWDLSRNSVDHRDRVNFERILEERLALLENMVTNRLNEIELSGEPEALPLITDTLTRIEEAEALFNFPAQAPFVQLMSHGANWLNIRVRGEVNVPYALQYSTNLILWTELPNALFDGQSQTITSDGNPGFIRARVKN